MSAHPALFVLELSSIARGVVCVDVMAKRAPVRILQTHPISPGKHIVVADGGVAEVEEAMGAALEIAGSALVDKLFLPQAHESLAPLLANASYPEDRHPVVPARTGMNSVGIVETSSVASTLLGADSAAKAARVTLLDLRLGVGLGGKGFFTMTGDLEDVQAAVAAATAAIDEKYVVGVEIIPAPHDDLHARLFW
jgi:microcompartment protein CcmL/EutN